MVPLYNYTGHLLYMGTQDDQTSVLSTSQLRIMCQS